MAKQFVLWGRHRSMCDGGWFKVAGGSLTDAERAEAERGREPGWFALIILPVGEFPSAGLFAQIVEAGIEYDYHESDLYVVDIPEARAILDKGGYAYRPFTGSHGGRWLDVPFAYEPYWAKKRAAV